MDSHALRLPSKVTRPTSHTGLFSIAPMHNALPAASTNLHSSGSHTHLPVSQVPGGTHPADRMTCLTTKTTLFQFFGHPAPWTASSHITDQATWSIVHGSLSTTTQTISPSGLATPPWCPTALKPGLATHLCLHHTHLPLSPSRPANAHSAYDITNSTTHRVLFQSL